MADFKDGFGKILETEDTTDTFDPADIKENNIIAGLAYLIFFIPLVAKPNSAFGKYHANQGLVYLIAVIVVQIALIFIGIPLGFIPFIGGILKWFISLGFNLVIIALFVVGLINACNGKAKELPLIGKIKIIK